MPVTDLSGGLPWWATQQGPAGGPGTTGGPAAAPQGGGQDILAYLSQLFGISPAQAQQLMSAQGGDNPHGDGPPPPPMQNFGNFQPRPGPGPGNVGPVPGLNAMQPAPQPAQPPLSSSFSSFPSRPPVPQAPAPIATPNQPYGGPLAAADAASAPRGGAYGNMPFPGQRDPTGFWGPRPGPLATPQSSAAVGGGGASGVGATSNPRFITDTRPNMAAEGGGQSRGGPPQMGMLNLAGMFGPLAARRRT